MSNKPKNILFLMTDQHRADYVGYFGSGKIVTPNIDRIADGIWFQNAISPNPVCTPTRCALLTGKYPHQIGMRAMSGDLDPQHPTYPRALQQAGYYTAGIGKFHWLQSWPWDWERGKGIPLSSMHEQIRQFGFDYTWETSGKELAYWNYCDYAEYLSKKGLLELYRDHVCHRGTKGAVGPQGKGVRISPIPDKDYIDIVTADKIIETIKKRPDSKPFCIFGSFCSPHPPFDPPREYFETTPLDESDDFVVAPPGDPDWLYGTGSLSDSDKRDWYNIRRAYKAMIRLVDDQIGRIFQALEEEGILNDTVIIFTSDHGEQLGDRSLEGKDRPWQESVRVPCAIRHPDYITGRSIAAPIELTDITATILDVAGLEPQKALSRSFPVYNDIVPCRSLLSVLRGETDKIREFAFSEGYSNWELIQTEQWKYIQRNSFSLEYQPPIEHLYDLLHDPNCLVDLSTNPKFSDIMEWCRQRRNHILAATPPAQMKWAPTQE